MFRMEIELEMIFQRSWFKGQWGPTCSIGCPGRVLIPFGVERY